MVADMDGSENDACADKFMDEVSKVDAGFQPRVVLPGDILTSAFQSSGQVLKLGQGLVRRDDQILASLPGKLNYRVPSMYWVDTCRKKYLPKVGDQVVGVVEERGGDFYIMNVFSGSNCILNRLSFEGATKRNRPELKKGDVVYARVTSAGKDCDTELSCISSSGVKKDWSTGETIYGGLPEGLTIHVSLAMARKLLRPDSAVLNALGRHLIFEVAVGMNGCVWLRSSSGSLETILIRNAILNAEALDDLQAEAMVEQLVAMAAKMAKQRKS